MKLIWQYLKKYRKILWGSLILATINRVFSLLDPQIFRLLIDNYATKFEQLEYHKFISGVLLLLGGTVGVAFVSRVAKNFQDYFVSVITQRLGAQLYADSVSHSFALPYATFEDQRSGELLQKLEKARTDVEKMIAGVINIVFFSFIGIAFVLTYAFMVHWILGVVYFSIIPVLGFVTFFISKKVKVVQAQIVKEQASLAGSTTETLRNVELVKSLGLENQEIKRLNSVNEQILLLDLRKVKLIRTLSFIQGTLINALRSLLMFLMLWLIYQHEVTLGQFFSLLFYSFFIFNPLAEFGDFISQYRETQASVDQLQKIIAIPAESKPASPKSVGKIKTIAFKDLNFQYSTSGEPSLSQINITIKAGQTIAFVGPSGSGKTTLVKLLVGLYKPTSGQIFFDDINTVDIDFSELRKRIGLVSQDVQLFAGTIRDNLLFVNPQASDKDCLQAIKEASAEAILARGNDGLNTKIGENGIKLSGGEKQRLAIARALLRKPDLIIFDEATSSLDSITENSITETIKNIEKSNPQLMRVLIAHRLSTIMHADVIYVLKQGRIVEQGSHSQLLSSGKLYAALWQQQGTDNNHAK